MANIVIPVDPTRFVNVDRVSVAVARTPGGPVTDTLFILTGVVGANFSQTQPGIRRDTIQFEIPDDPDRNSGNLIPFKIPQGQKAIDSMAMGALASINGDATMAVDNVNLFFSDPDKGTITFTADLAADNTCNVNRIAYQVTLQLGPV
jgi:hypothetical protein